MSVPASRSATNWRLGAISRNTPDISHNSVRSYLVDCFTFCLQISAFNGPTPAEAQARVGKC
jgi:hypothetical protein